MSWGRGDEGGEQGWPVSSSALLTSYLCRMNQALFLGSGNTGNKQSLRAHKGPENACELARISRRLLKLQM